VFGEGERQGGNEPVTVQFQKWMGAGKEKKHRGNLKVHLELLPLALVRADSADSSCTVACVRRWYPGWPWGFHTWWRMHGRPKRPLWGTWSRQIDLHSSSGYVYDTPCTLARPIRRLLLLLLLLEISRVMSHCPRSADDALRRGPLAGWTADEPVLQRVYAGSNTPRLPRLGTHQEDSLRVLLHQHLSGDGAGLGGGLPSDTGAAHR
jgi:hypothetical protein